MRGSMKTYKYWLYYKINDDETDSYDLYAYTNDKSISEIFEKQRNMGKFYRAIKKMTTEDVHDLAENYQCMIVEMVPIEFYDKDTDESYTVQYALTTTEKLDFIYYMSNTSITIYKNSWTNPLIFNDEIQKALFNLNYYKYYLHIADTLSSDAKKKLSNKVVENIRQICEDGGFYPSQQQDEYFNTYIDMIYKRIPDLEEDVKVDQLAILVKCIKDTI